MINIKEYLESGIIEKYCLGLATIEEANNLEKLCQRYPEIRSFLDENQRALEQLLVESQYQAKATNKQIIFDRLENLNLANFQLNHQGRLPKFINITPHSDALLWQKLIQPIQANHPFDNIYTHPLFSNKNQQLYLLWIVKNIPEEFHPDLNESVLILEGTCTCTTGGVDHKMQVGSFMQIPSEESHKFVVTSETPVKALLSRVKIA